MNSKEKKVKKASTITIPLKEYIELMNTHIKLKQENDATKKEIKELIEETEGFKHEVKELNKEIKIEIKQQETIKAEIKTLTKNKAN